MIPHWLHHFLAILSKMHDFVENSVFSAKSARFVIFAPGTPLFRGFQVTARFCIKQRFQPKISTFCHFPTGCTNFERFSAKCMRLYKVPNTVFSPRSPRFVILTLGVPRFDDFQQSARVCTKQRFHPEISTFPHFCTGCTTCYRFLAKCVSLHKTAFSARDQHVSSFSH